MAKTVRDNRPKRVDLAQIGDEMGRKPPQAIDIEEAVLGALLLEPEVAPDVLDQLTSDCFYKESNKKIYSSIERLSRQGNPIDILTVSNDLAGRQATEGKTELDEVGGSAYLSQLSLRIGAASHVAYHTKILLQKYIQRELISVSYEAQRDAFDDTIPVDDLVDSVQSKIFALAEHNMRNETTPIQSVINTALSEIEESQKREDGLSGVPSGFTGIDKVTFGWQKGDFIVLAARPSVGKTAFVLTMARNMTVEHKIPVAFFSLEMPATQLVKRIMISETGLTADKIRGAKKMTNEDWQQLQIGLNKLSEAPLWIDDTGSISIYEFRSKARRLVANNHVKLIIIDYLQLMTGPPELRGMREQEVSTISRQLKTIAKELNIPIIALSQLSRAVETRGGGGRPQLSDLRESGAIEQDADIVMFIHRPEKAGVQDDNSFPGETNLIIAKHRNGEVCDVKMRFISSEVKFVDNNDSLSDIPGMGGIDIPSRMNIDDSYMEPADEFDIQ